MVTPANKSTPAGTQLASAVSLVKIPGLTLLPALAAAMLPLSGIVLPRIAATSRLFRLAVLLAVACAPYGLLTLWVSERPHAGFVVVASVLLWVLGFVLIPGTMLYLTEVLTVRAVTVAAVLGAAGDAAYLNHSLAWKGDFGIFATMLALSLTAGRTVATRLVLLASIVLSVHGDARGQSLFGFCALIYTFIGPKIRERIKKNWIGSSLVGIALGFAIVKFYLHAALAGWLGPETQARTLGQEATGNLILAARQEWAAAFEVFKAHHWGYGPGVLTPPTVQLEALGSVRVHGGDYTARYWTTDVFANRHDFHSMFVDLWYHFGVCGVALALTIVLILLKAFTAAARSRDFGTLAIFSLASGAWDLFFSPMANQSRLDVALFLAAVLALGRDWTSAPSMRRSQAGDSRETSMRDKTAGQPMHWSPHQQQQSRLDHTRPSWALKNLRIKA